MPTTMMSMSHHALHLSLHLSSPRFRERLDLGIPSAFMPCRRRSLLLSGGEAMHLRNAGLPFGKCQVRVGAGRRALDVLLRGKS